MGISSVPNCHAPGAKARHIRRHRRNRRNVAVAARQICGRGKKRGDIWREWSMNHGEWRFISYNWLFLWDYTFYKWGFVIVLITGKGPNMYGEWWSSALESISLLNKSLLCPKAASRRGSNLDGFWTPRNCGVVGETNKNIPGLINFELIQDSSSSKVSP